MARTYNGSPVLSKIKLPGSQNPYYLKDADARTILDAIDDGVYTILQQALGTVDAGGNHLVNAENIKAYVDRIAEVGFDVVVLTELPHPDAPTEEDYKNYHNNIVLIADNKSTTGAYVEYVILRQGDEGSYTYKWERIGTTQVDLNGYLKNVSYVDGTHTLQETKNVNGVETTTDVHTFGNLADANTASGTYTVATGDGSTTINVYELSGGNAAATTVTGATDVEYVNGLTGTYKFTTNGIKTAVITDDGVSSATVTVVKGITGTQIFNTDAINDVAFVDNAETGAGVVNVVKGITGTQTFVTSAIDSVTLTSSATTNTVVTGLTGTTSFAPYAFETSVEGECLTFATVTNSSFDVNTTDLGVTTTQAQTGSFAIETKNVGLKTTAAATASFAVETKDLGLHTEDSNTGEFAVTTKHIHFTPSTTVTDVTVNRETATVTVYPDATE